MDKQLLALSLLLAISSISAMEAPKEERISLHEMIEKVLDSIDKTNLKDFEQKLKDELIGPHETINDISGLNRLAEFYIFFMDPLYHFPYFNKHCLKQCFSLYEMLLRQEGLDVDAKCSPNQISRRSEKSGGFCGCSVLRECSKKELNCDKHQHLLRNNQATHEQVLEIFECGLLR